MARKKGSGEGTIYKTPNGWRGQIFLGSKRVSFSAKKKGDVIEKIAAARIDHQRGNYIFETDVTVEEWCKVWLKDRIENTIAHQTYMKYDSVLRNHIYPNFGTMRLQELNPTLIENKYKEIKLNELSQSMVDAITRNFKRSLEYAVTKNILPKNPHVGVKVYNVTKQSRILAYTAEEQKQIINYILSHGRYFWIYYLLLFTGMRYGEAVGLTWEDVDFKNQTITINKTAVEINGSWHIQNKPKTDAGNRTISVLPKLLDFLKKIKKELDERKNHMNLVVPNTNYNILSGVTARAIWQRACLDMGIEYRGLHVLRHTWATRALEAGMDIKTTSQMLGHKNVSVTMNIYQDALKAHQESSIEKISKYF